MKKNSKKKAIKSPIPIIKKMAKGKKMRVFMPCGKMSGSNMYKELKLDELSVLNWNKALEVLKSDLKKEKSPAMKKEIKKVISSINHKISICKRRVKDQKSLIKKMLK